MGYRTTTLQKNSKCLDERFPGLKILQRQGETDTCAYLFHTHENSKVKMHYCVSATWACGAEGVALKKDVSGTV